MNRSTPGLPVHHQLLEFTQTHIHRVSDAIQPSHSLSSPSPPAPNPPSIRVFSNESTLRMRGPKYWNFSFSIIPSKEHPGLTQTLVHPIGDAIQISSSVIPFSSHLQSFPASGSFLMSQFFASGGQSLGASASVLLMNIQG